jgi:hypothetical protein
MGTQSDGRRLFVSMAYDVTDQKAYEDQLMRESNHRAKNVLSLVQAIARQTVRAGSDRPARGSVVLAGRLPDANLANLRRPQSVRVIGVLGTSQLPGRALRL